MNENKPINVLWSRSLLACLGVCKNKVPMRRSLWGFRAIAASAVLVCAQGSNLQAYTTVLISSAAPSGLETQFLASATNQYVGTITPNPLASNTYTLKLFGSNPNYNAPPTPPTTLKQALSLGSTVYLYGYRDGAGYEEHVDNGIAQGFSINCSTPMPNVPTWDAVTCAAVSTEIANEIFNQYASTVPVVPGF